jgi:hypothetical protein
MALTPWINWDNGDQLLDIRNKLNTFNTSVNDVVDQNTEDISTNASGISVLNTGLSVLDGRVTQNESDIAQNATDISTNASAITTNAPFAPTYDFVSTNYGGLSSDTYVTIAELITPNRAAGVYEFKLSQVFSYNNTSRSYFCRVSFDGGINWVEFRHEPKDNTDNKAQVCLKPEVRATEAPLHIVLQARCESAGDTAIISIANIIAERKA